MMCEAGWQGGCILPKTDTYQVGKLNTVKFDALSYVCDIILHLLTRYVKPWGIIIRDVAFARQM